MFRKITILSILLLYGPSAFADLNNIVVLSQSNFRLLSEDLSSALAYRSLAPAESLGVTGFDIAVEVGYTKIQNQSVWEAATLGNAPSALVVPRLHVTKGLPLGIDIGAVYAAIPDSNIRYAGGELKYAFLKGGVAKPALAARVGYIMVSGVQELAFNSTSFDVLLSKGFAFLTPYAGIGVVRTNSRPRGAAQTAGLQDERIDQGRYFVGLNINLAVINIGIDLDRTGDLNTYSAKVGWRF